MSTLRERVQHHLRERGPLTDAELRQLTGARSHQHVNQVCRRMAAQGEIERRPGPDRRIRNVLRPGLQDPAIPGFRRLGAALSGTVRSSTAIPSLDDPEVLLVLPCSARKASSGAPAGEPRSSIVDDLPPPMASQLQDARNRVASLAEVHGTGSLAALDRYDGQLYQQLDRHRLRTARCSTVILSGGYGLVDAEETIGTYNRELHVGDWPDALLGRALVRVARARGSRHVVGFLASTTAYATVFRNAPWDESDARVTLVSVGRGGSTSATPRALGRAVMDALAGALNVSEGQGDTDLALTVETLNRPRTVTNHDIREAITGLTDPTRRRTPSNPIPEDDVWGRPGLYAWWADDTARTLLAAVLGVEVLPQLVYAGQAGATAWPSGRVPTTTLCRRVLRNHLHGNVNGSTFRRTLAALVGPWIGPVDEGVLSAWMHEHLQVSVWPYDDRDRLGALEHGVLDSLDPWLNLEGRPSSEARSRISDLRRTLD